MLRKLVLGIAILASAVVGVVAFELVQGPIRIEDLRSGARILYESPRHPPTTSRVYKQTPTRALRVHVFQADPAEVGATIVLFHGGGFFAGWPDELYPIATALAMRGHTVFVPEYRLQLADGIAYPEELEDCRDAVAWVAREAVAFGVDEEKLVIGGSSAGAHLAAALLTLPRADSAPFPEVPEVPEVAEVIGLVLMAPYLDSADSSERFDREPPRQGPLARRFGRRPADVFEGRSPEYSPRAHLHPDLPPTLILAGAEDPLWPSADEYCRATRALGVECTARAFPGAGHAFALKGRANHEAAIEELATTLRRWLETRAD